MFDIYRKDLFNIINTHKQKKLLFFHLLYTISPYAILKLVLITQKILRYGSFFIFIKFHI